MHRNGLIFFINRFVNNITEAEEIADDTFLELIIHPKRYSFETSLKTYLYAIGRNKAVSYIRKRKNLLPDSLDDNNSITSDELTLEESFIRFERDQKINTAINKLPPDQRAFVHLMYFENQSYDEIGRVLGKTKKQLYNLSQTVKESLRILFEKDGITI